ncbi:hypothetical protein [Aliiroseovarius sp.]|uniref:hypothetical protein n=1 Tax=Aliiroseovarius sp. TaxID=1872442 RepID=UPI003BABE42F
MPTNAASWRRVTAREEFCALFAEKLLRGPDGLLFTLHADGQLTGHVNGDAFSGQWRWLDGYFCRDLGDGREECETIETDGTRMRYIRNKGAGAAVIVSIA